MAADPPLRAALGNPQAVGRPSRRSPASPPLVPAPVVRGASGAVATPHHLASQAGLGVLRAGGTAVDAAIAANAALAVVTSYMCGLGGDAFWLIHDGIALHALNGSGRSAEGATIEAARATGLDEIPVRGPWTVTVPGAIRSWGDAHARFGRLPWASLLAPAIELADAFPASAAWSDSVERAAAGYGTESDWAQVFRPFGRAWVPGEVVRLPALAGTLRALADAGPDAAYSGGIARSSAAYLEAHGSPLRAADFASHASDWTQPLVSRYRSVTATSHPLNSVGVISLELLQVLQEFTPPDPDAFGPLGVADARWVHVGLEAARLTMADRDRYVTDPDHAGAGTAERLLDPAHARDLAARIGERRVPDTPTSVRGGGGTVYLATVDAAGMAVSLIESNYAGFGSGLVDPATGIAFQNRGAFFRLDPSHANALAPRKRTLHTLSPGMLLRDGRPWIVHGSMGGEIQPQVFAQFVSSVVDGGVDIATAVAAPRWAADVEHHFGPPSLTVLERRYREDVQEALAGMGHDVRVAGDFDSGMGHQHAIEIVEPEEPGAQEERDGWDATGPRAERGTRTLVAVTDPRSEGLPAAW